MGQKKVNIKKEILGAVISSLVCIALFAAVAGFFLWANTIDDIPKIIIILYVAVPVIVIATIIFALVQRIKKLKQGEMDDASQY